MKVLVIGSNGKVGRRVVKKLCDQDHEVLAMIRNEAQKTELQAMGASVVVADLEKDISAVFKHAPDAVIFSAGSGSSTGKDKTTTVDLQGALKSIDEAVKHNVDRYIMVSALGTDDPDKQPPAMEHYYRAKSESDQYLVQSELDYTIFRPGRLTDEQGNGSVRAAQRLDNRDNPTISRDDLATSIVYALDKANTYEKVIELLDGRTPVPEAIDRI